jgi:hypothetical protein
MGSIITPPRQVHASPRRLGSSGWRLTNTTHGKAVRRARRPRNSAVVSNRPQVERILPTLDDNTALAIVRLLTSDTSHALNLNVHDK